MKKAILISTMLIITMIVFSIGVLSGLYNDQAGFEFSRKISKSENRYNKLDYDLKYKNKDFHSISGDETIINGIPIKLWFGNNVDQSQTIADYYLNDWAKKGFFVEQRGNDNTSFTHAIDHKTKTFYGALAQGKKRQDSILLPFSIDMSKINKKVEWDNDFPRSLKKKKGFHFKSNDGSKAFEKFLYLEKYPVSQTVSYIKNELTNCGWQHEKSVKRSADYGEANIMLFSQDTKNCIVNIAKNEQRGEHGSVVLICIGRI